MYSTSRSACSGVAFAWFANFSRNTSSLHDASSSPLPASKIPPHLIRLSVGRCRLFSQHHFAFIGKREKFINRHALKPLMVQLIFEPSLAFEQPISQKFSIVHCVELGDLHIEF